MANEIAEGIAELGATCVRLYGELATAEAATFAALATAKESLTLNERALALLAQVEVERDESAAQAQQSAEAAEAAHVECDAMRGALSRLSSAVANLEGVAIPAPIAFELSNALKAAREALARPGADDVAGGDVP